MKNGIGFISKLENVHKILSNFKQKTNFVEGVGVTLSCPYLVGYIQRPLVNCSGSLQYFIIKKSELHEAKKKKKNGWDAKKPIEPGRRNKK